MVNNLVSKAEDLSQSSTIVEYASLFDRNRKLDKSVRIKYLKQLHLVYGREITLTVLDDDAKGDLHEFSLRIVYPPKLDCSEDTLVTEMNSLWPTITKKWLKFKDLIPEASRIRRFWIELVSEYALDFPNLCDLIILLLAFSPGTRPVERSFSKLAKMGKNC